MDRMLRDWAMNKKYYVYRHTSPSGKCYIGITSLDPHKRWKNGSNYKTSPCFYNAILKYGWKNITHEILFIGLSKCEAEAKEKELIAFYKSDQRKFGYNLATGGHLGSHHGEETLKKMSEASLKMWGREGFRENWVSKRIGVPKSEETKQKQSVSAHLRTDNKRPVIQMDLEGNILNIFTGLRVASRETGVNTASISKCCKGLYEETHGFKWRYADKYQIGGAKEDE